MKTRNRKALQDVTPGNTPQTKKIARGTLTLKEQLLGSSKRLSALDLRGAAGDDDEDVLPKLAVLPTEHSPTEVAARRSVLTMESTPLDSRTRVIHSVKKPTTSDVRQPFSPLPPSSPPSMSSFYDEDAENRPPPEPRHEDDEDDENNYEGDENAIDLQPENTHRQPSSDDPFGFTALEKRLKLQRETRRRSAARVLPMAVQKDKGKAVARHRPPLGELDAPPVASTSAAAAVAEVDSRAPTPYHPSDDLEDMYLDPRELQSAEERALHHHHHSDAHSSLLGPPLELAQEDENPVERELSSDYDDPTATPHPQHVANIIPEAWPVSSREGTPCDRSLPDSPVSSPSPVKPLTVTRPLPVAGSSTAKRHALGKLPFARAFASSTPIPTPLPAAKRARLQAIASSSKLPRSTAAAKEKDRQAKEREVEAEVEVEEVNPALYTRNLERLLPKRPLRQRAPPAALPDTSSPTVTRTVTKTRKGEDKGKGHLQTKTREPEGSDEERDVEDGGGPSEDQQPSVVGPSSSPLAERKRKATPRRSFPVKRRRVEVVITKRPPKPSGRAQPQPAAKPQSRGDRGKAKVNAKDKGKAKAKAKAGPQKVGDEDSVRVPHPRD